MIDNYYIGLYIKCAWLILSPEDQSIKKYEQFNKKYSTYVINLVNHSQLSLINLVISLHYLYKYKENSVNTLHKYDYSIISYLIVVSLILSNKAFDDQSYTLKTWLNILRQQSKDTIKLDLKLLNELELHFLNVLNYNLSFSKIDSNTKFWDLLGSRVGKLKIPNLIINQFKLQVSSDLSHTTPNTNNYFSPMISKKNSPLLSSATVATSSYSPLTPLTPYSLPFDFKKRKLNSGIPLSVAVSYYNNNDIIQNPNLNNYCI